MAAAAPTPAKPKGMNGDQLALSIDEAPTVIKNAITASLMRTMVQVARALSFTPTTKIPVTRRTMIAAGRFAIPPSVPGAWVAQYGSSMLQSFRMAAAVPEPAPVVPAAEAVMSGMADLPVMNDREN